MAATCPQCRADTPGFHKFYVEVGVQLPASGIIGPAPLGDSKGGFRYKPRSICYFVA